MKWTIKKVRETLKGKLIGKPYMREMVCKTILLLPSQTIEFVCTKVWFISSPEDAWAFTFRGSDIKDRSLIILSDELFLQSEMQITYTILHELGHVILHHRNSIGFEQIQSEIDQQESAADKFAKKFMSENR